MALGSLAMAVSHAGVTVPGLAALGPGGDRPVPPAAAGFSVATGLFALVAVGAWGTRAWAWATGLIVNGLALVAAGFPWRGPASGVGVALTVAALLALISGPGRRALLGRGSFDAEAEEPAT